MAKAKQKNQPRSVELDLNNPEFQAGLFALQNAEKLLALDMLRKVAQLTWDQVHRDKGLRWEKILSVTPDPATKADAYYSIRISRGRRAIAYRDGNIMRMVSIPPDHDSTYQ